MLPGATPSASSISLERKDLFHFNIIYLRATCVLSVVDAIATYAKRRDKCF